MKININGVTRDMTAEEETEILVNMEGAEDRRLKCIN